MSLVGRTCDDTPGRSQGPAGGRLGPWPDHTNPASEPWLPCPPGPGEDPGWARREAVCRCWKAGGVPTPPPPSAAACYRSATSKIKSSYTLVHMGFSI